jgi:hypothetical protein
MRGAYLDTLWSQLLDLRKRLAADGLDAAELAVAEYAAVPWRQTALPAEVFWQDFLEFVGEVGDFGGTSRQEAELFAHAGVRGDPDLVETLACALHSGVRLGPLGFRAREVLGLPAYAQVAAGAVDRFSVTATVLGSEDWQPLEASVSCALRRRDRPCRTPGGEPAGVPPGLGTSPGRRTRPGTDYHDTGRGPHAGLGPARRIAHVTCRSEPEWQVRFGRTPQGTEDPWYGGRYQVESCLDTTPPSWCAASTPAAMSCRQTPMNTHDIGRGRGDRRAA